ncbi:cytochrome P450 6B5-like [Battus philenor]|uniref:cytochrome P450 6B5-like n=1 Tax=Battus philenor TaxID=42288 RepID=UPI0035CF1FFD
MFYLLVFVITVFGILYYYFTRTFNYWKKRGIVGPKPLPFYGNLKETVLRREPIAMTMKKIYDTFSNEKVVGIFRLTTPCLLLRDTNLIKHVMIKDFDLFDDRGIQFSDTGLGVNLFHADGDRWRILRNKFTPLFTSGKLKNMLYLIIQRGDQFIQYVESLCEKQTEQPIHILLQKYTMSTIAACAFGVDLDDQTIERLNEMDKLMFTLNYSGELDMMYPGILKKLNISLFPTSVKTFFDNLVKTVIKQRGGVPTDRKDFMDLILELRQKKEVTGGKRQGGDEEKTIELTESVIAAQAFVFYAAGYETSASTMTYLLYELAKNPKVQNKLIAQIDEVLQRHRGEITYETLKEISYSDRIFDETLRKYAIADPLVRKARCDYTFPDTDITVKKGQTVVVSVWGLHRDPKYYPDPDKFDPERFSPENENNRDLCAYLPFGTGPRNCIGMRFAKLESKVAIVKLLSKFRVESSKNTPVNITFDPMRVVVFPEGGIYLKFIRRGS